MGHTSLESVWPSVGRYGRPRAPPAAEAASSQFGVALAARRADSAYRAPGVGACALACGLQTPTCMKLDTHRAPPSASIPPAVSAPATKLPPSAPSAPPAPAPKGYAPGDVVDTKPKFVAAPTAADVKAGKAALRMGQQGPAVGDLQKLLGLPATGRFDKNTEVGVALFQKAEGLPTTGVVDAKTLAALEAKAAAKAKAAGASTPSTPGASTPSAPGTSTPSASTPSATPTTGAAPATGLAAPPPKTASPADKYDYATAMLTSGTVKPGKSAAADALITKMIHASGPGVTDPDAAEHLAARKRFLAAAAAAGYSVPVWAR